MHSEFTMSRPWRRVQTTDDIATAFASLVPTTTMPSGDGVINLLDEALGWSTHAHQVPDQLELILYGSDAANEDYHFRVTGWNKFHEAGHAVHRTLWVPTHRVTLLATMGAVAITDLMANGLVADNLSIVTGNAAGAVVNTPAGDLSGSLTLKTFGHQLLQFEWDLDAGSVPSASGNALIRPINQKA